MHSVQQKNVHSYPVCHSRERCRLCSCRPHDIVVCSSHGIRERNWGPASSWFLRCEFLCCALWIFIFVLSLTPHFCLYCASYTSLLQPLGLLKDADQKRFDHLRYVENKHGRIAMLAVLGHIVTTKGDRFPGEIAFGVNFADMKAGIAAFSTIPQAGVLQLFMFIGLLELGFSTVQADVEAACEEEMDRQGWSEAIKQSKASIELNNGRAAQMGILGLMVHERLDGNPYVLNAMLGAPVAFN